MCVLSNLILMAIHKQSTENSSANIDLHVKDQIEKCCVTILDSDLTRFLIL